MCQHNQIIVDPVYVQHKPIITLVHALFI